MIALSPILRVAALATAAATSNVLLSAQCVVDPNYGTNLGLTDDSVSSQQLLGFNFAFAGATYDAVYVSSNGFAYLFNTTGSVPPPTNSQCCNGNVAGLLASASPMVCGLWMDLNPSSGGSVNFNALPGKALITWVGVPEYPAVGAITFQIVLTASTGTISFVYDGTAASTTHNALVGWSPGNNAADPGNSNLSSRPIIAGNATVYELFGANTFDLAGTALAGIPTGPSSWLVDTPVGCASSSQYGRGCPEPCDFYELFASGTFDLSTGSLLFTANGNGSYTVTNCANCFDTNFSNNLALTDDSFSVGNALGFTFSYCGGSTTSVDVCSNGFIGLVSGAITVADFTPTVPELLAQGARVCPLWMDLNPSAGGGVFFDALPGKALITWNQVPAFGAAGSSNTMQLQLFPNGNMVMAWPQANNNASTGGGAAITGFSQGNGIGDPGASDMSAVPFTTGTGVPLVLNTQAGSRPIVGTTVVLEGTHVRPGTLPAGNLIIGISDPNLDLSLFFQMPGCRLRASLDVLLSIPVSSPTTTVSLPIPNQNSLVGRGVNTQLVMADLSLGGMPVYLSNGLLLTIGR